MEALTKAEPQTLESSEIPPIIQTERERHVSLGLPDLRALTSGVVVLFLRPGPGRSWVPERG
jgi:hypothetical protein